MDRAFQYLADVITDHDLGLSDALKILQIHFSRASQPGGSNIVVYSHASTPTLTLQYNRKGVIEKLEAGPELKNDDIERLIAAFTAARPRHVWATVNFANVPAEGAWQYRDRSQVLPVPPEAPRPKQLIGAHPFSLEVAYDGAEEFQLDQFRATIATREVSRLLSGLLHAPEDRGGHYTRSEWVFIPQQAEDGTLNLESRHLQLGYTIDGFAARRSDFTVVENMPALELVPTNDYYNKRGIATSDVLILPDSFETLLDRYFALNGKDQERILRWCHWLNHARQVGSLSPSASHIAVVQAIEALMPPDESAPRCETCGQLTRPEPTQRFADFLQVYAPGIDREKDRKSLYQLRSALSHGGKLLSGELVGHAFSDFTPQSWDERELLITTRTLARIAGVNWLLADHGEHDKDRADGPMV
jgi:hypothetical protein